MKSKKSIMIRYGIEAWVNTPVYDQKLGFVEWDKEKQKWVSEKDGIK